MAGNIPKHKIKDSVFANLFQDKKHLLQLYQTLHPEDRGVVEDDIKDVTIKHILLDADYKLYVIFMGEKPENPPNIISLREDFFEGEKIALDAEARILYQEDENSIIGQYIIFCKVYNEQRNLYGKQKRQ